MILKIFRDGEEFFQYGHRRDIQVLDGFTKTTKSPTVKQGLLRTRERLEEAVRDLAKRGRLSISDDWGQIWGIRGEIEAFLILQKRCAADVIEMNYMPPGSKVTRELFRQDTYVAPMLNVFWWTEEPESDKAVTNRITEIIEPGAHRFLELGQKESFISDTLRNGTGTRILFVIFLLREDIDLTQTCYPMKVAHYPIPKEDQLYAGLVNDWINLATSLPDIRP